MMAATHRVWRSQQLCLKGIVLLTVLIAPGAFAAVNIGSIDDINFGSWSQAQGDIAASSDFCVLSTNRGGNRRDYSVTGIPWFAGSFGVAGPGGATIPFTVTFTDLLAGSSEQLQPYVRTPRNKTGVDNCGGQQTARVTVAFNAADLAAAPSGSYQQRVVLYATNNNSGSDFESFIVRLEITDQVRISNLDPIDLGSFDGANDLSGSDDVCVYRNSGGSSYTVQAEGEGGGGSFELTNSVDTVPYQVEYDDGGGFLTLAAGVPAAMNGASSASPDCGGAVNAAVRVTVAAPDLSTASPGAYGGTLTLLIAPQ